MVLNADGRYIYHNTNIAAVTALPLQKHISSPKTEAEFGEAPRRTKRCSNS